MAKKKRKKYPNLPAGFGTIRYLGSGRRNCFAVHPPSKVDEVGQMVRPPALCYVDDYVKGFAVLTAYKAGTYKPGMERELDVAPTTDVDALISRIVADYNTIKGVEDKHPEIKKLTFKEVYDQFLEWKYNNPNKKQLSKASKANAIVAFKNCKILHDREFTSIKVSELQDVLDSCPLKYSSIENIKSLFNQMYRYAIANEICSENKAALTTIEKENDDEHGVPYTIEQIRELWKKSDDEEVQFVLIMCYSGFRISEFKQIEVNLEQHYFHGGLKTASGKNRTVPIHPAIYEFVCKRIEKYHELFPLSVSHYRAKHFRPLMEKLNMVGEPRHTPHDCRHTFSMLCEKYGVLENDRKRMLGHSFGNDVTNAVYGHRELEDLVKEIEKIPGKDL